MNNLNISHLKQNQDLTCYQTHNKREKNQYGNWQIDNTSVLLNKREKEIKEDISKKSQLFVISAGILKFSAIIQPVPIPLDPNIELPKIHTRSVTFDTNEATFCTHFDSSTGMNIGNLKNTPMNNKHKSRYCRELYSIYLWESFWLNSHELSP